MIHIMKKEDSKNTLQKRARIVGDFVNNIIQSTLIIVLLSSTLLGIKHFSGYMMLSNTVLAAVIITYIIICITLVVRITYDAVVVYKYKKEMGVK